MMMIIKIVIWSSVVSWALCFPVRWVLLSWSIVDKPTDRSSHRETTPRGGGLAIIAAIPLALVFSGVPISHGPIFFLLIATIPLVAVSLVDDMISLAPSFRIMCQSAVAALAITLLYRQFPSLLPDGGFLFRGFVVGIILVWLVGYANAFNFMDGINGLAASQAVFAGSGSVVLAYLGSNAGINQAGLLSIALSGAAAGFLPHNATRPRLFMGDVGSVPLGFLLASLTLWLACASGWSLLPPMLLLHANFILDTAITLLRRIFGGEEWLKPHREHFYQKLVRSGWSHARVTAIEMALQLLVFGAMLLYLRVGTQFRAALGAFVISLWLGFFAWAEARFRRNQYVQPALDRSGLGVGD